MNNIKELFFSFNHKEIKKKRAINFINQKAYVGNFIYQKTYEELYRDIILFITFFLNNDNKIFHNPGNIYALIGTNAYEWIIAFFSILLSGNNVKLIDPNLDQKIINSFINGKNVTAVFASPEVIIKCNFDINKEIKIISYNDQGKKNKNIYSFYDVFNFLIKPKDINYHLDNKTIERIKNIPIDNELDSVFIYTSGTTKNPKCVGLSPKNLLSLSPYVSDFMKLTKKDVMLVIIPFYHVFGLVSALITPLYSKLSFTLLREINSLSMMKAIKHTDVSIILAVPALWKTFYRSIFNKITTNKNILFRLMYGYLKATNGKPVSLLDKIALSALKLKLGKRLRLFVSGGAKATEEHMVFFSRLGIKTLEGYGLTETSGVIIANPVANIKLGSIGKPLGPTQIKIKNKNQDGIGEIWVRGPSVFLGYAVNSHLDRSSFDDNNFLNTGDLGYVDNDGYVYICGRKKDIIVLASGKNVYPDELEAYYGESPFISEIAVLGISENGEEKVCAAILPNFDRIKEQNGTEAVRLFIKREIESRSIGLPSYKKIHKFVLVQTELPKTTTRKFKKGMIRESIKVNEPLLLTKEQMPEQESGYGEGKSRQDLESLIFSIIKKHLPDSLKKCSLHELKELNLETDLGFDSILRYEIFYTVGYKFQLKLDISKYINCSTLSAFITALQCDIDDDSKNKSIKTTEKRKKPPRDSLQKSTSKNSKTIYSNDYEKFSKPLLVNLLKLLKLDINYHKAVGNYLYYYTANGKEIKVDDFVGGYGSVLLGHNPKEIIETAIDNLKSNIPFHTQMSLRNHTGLLAKELNAELGKGTNREYIITFTNSGTEAVEAAIKHAMCSYLKNMANFFSKFEKKFANIKAYHTSNQFSYTFLNNRFDHIDEFKKFIELKNKELLKQNEPKLLAAERAFHGKTTGSLMLTFKREYRVPFLGEKIHADFFSFSEAELNNLIEKGNFELYLPELNSHNELIITKVKNNKYAALFIEPIQGEGGVYPVPEEFLRFIRKKTREYNIVLCFDEIQSGFYRTGDFLASFASRVNADYYLLGKALGGGVSKIACLAVDKELYDEDFSLLHTSTFAEDEFSSIVSLKALRIIRQKALQVKEKGRYLKNKLLALKSEFPEIVKEVRGKGLILGLEFKEFTKSKSGALNLLSNTGFFNYLVAGFLLRKYQIRIAAPLSTSCTIRIQPSIEVRYEEIDKLYEALKMVCKILYNEDVYMLIEYFLEQKYQHLRTECKDFKHGRIYEEEPLETAYKVGFLVHYADKSIRLTEPSLFDVDDQTLTRFLKDLLPLAKPIMVGSNNIKSKTGKIVHITFIGLPFTSDMYREAYNNNEIVYYKKLCQSAVEILEKQKVKLIGFGQYNSIITENCTDIACSKIGLTSGNAFTVYAGIRALFNKIEEKGINYKRETLGVIGAGGNICSVFAEYFSRYTKNILLYGGTSERGWEKALKNAKHIYIQAVKSILKKGNPDGELENFIVKTDIFKNIIKNKNKNGFSANEFIDELQKELQYSLPIKAVKRLEELQNCKIVIAATSDPKAFLEPKHFSENAILCDLSVPTNCTQDLLINKKNISVIRGGIVDLPNKENIKIVGFPLREGKAFACISETLLLGFEEYENSFSYGHLTTSQIDYIAKLGDKHGFVIN